MNSNSCTLAQNIETSHTLKCSCGAVGARWKMRAHLRAAVPWTHGLQHPAPSVEAREDRKLIGDGPVSYTHLTLPTKA